MPNRREAYIRLVEHYLNIANAAMQNGDLSSIDVENDNIRVAVEFCLGAQNFESLAKFFNSLGHHWLITANWDILLPCVQALVERDLQDEKQRADAFDVLAEAEEIQGNYARARGHLQEQITLLNQGEPRDLDRLRRTLRRAIDLAILQQDEDETLHLWEDLYVIAQEQRNYREQVNILVSEAELYEKKNEFDHARRTCNEGLELARRIRYKSGEIDILVRFASMLHSQLLNKEAQSHYQKALMLAEEIGDRVRTSEIRRLIAILEAALGRDIFISYNQHDRDFVERLSNDLKSAGFSVWWDEWEIKVGDSIIQKVSNGIKQSAFLAVVLSPHSVQSSWVQREVGSALMRQLSTDRGIAILPLLVSDCEIPILLQEIKYADFRHDYKLAFDKLLNTLI